MPKDIKGKDGLMVLWAIRKLKEFISNSELKELEFDSSDIDIDWDAIALMQNVPISKKNRIKHNVIWH